MHSPLCHHCQKKSELVKGDAIYTHRHDLHDKFFWFCKDCNAWVGCHRGSNEALGTPANSELRALRHRAHEAFDPLWKWGSFSRSNAYQWLSKRLGIDVQDCHIGQFGPETCRKVIAACFEERARQAQKRAERQV